MSFDKNIHPNSHRDQNMKHFHYTAMFPGALLQSPPTLPPAVTTILISMAIA